jgi:adenylate cyclase, class 2
MIGMAAGKHASRNEVEIKLAIDDLARARNLLRKNGFHIKRRRVFERNILFDHPGTTLRNSGRMLRLREAGGRATLTYKGPGNAGGPHKSREELEVILPNAEEFARLLERLDYVPIFEYQKYRTEYEKGRSGVVTLDETPVGNYLEVEGPPDWIDKTAEALGFQHQDYLTASYGSIYLEDCRKRRKKPRNMVFRGKPPKLKTRTP